MPWNPRREEGVSATIGDKDNGRSAAPPASGSTCLQSVDRSTVPHVLGDRETG